MDHPISSCTLPASGKKVKFRPFLEKERKLLLMVAENKEEIKLKDVTDVIKQIANNCLVDSTVLDTMPAIDLEYLFLQFRMKSMGEIVNRQFVCKNEIEKKPCGNILKVDIDLSKVDVVNLDKDKIIKLSPTVSIKMKYPSINVDDFETEYDAISSCIEFVANVEQIYYAKDYTKIELFEFLTHLNMAQFERLENFYNDAPMLKTNIQHKCNKCGFNHEIVFEGLQSFFI